MRTTAIIITILFVLALSLLLVFAFNFLSPSGRTINDGKEIITTTRTTSGTDGNTATSGQTTAAGPEKEDMSIEKIEVYLDGTKEAGGIFLGEAEYGLASPETESMYGGEFSKSGFELSWDSTGYVFEPGTTHSFYVYAYIPKFTG